MIGRNEPCLCGSGKKYKKCCENKEVKSTQQVMMEEIESTLQTFYNTYPERKDIREYIELVQAWGPKLEGALQRELIEAVVLDEFFYHHRIDIWQSYLKRSLKKMVRPSTINLLARWETPTLFVGQILAVHEQYMEAKHLITEEVYQIRRENNKPIPEDMYVFAFIVDDGSDVAQHVLALSTLIFFPKEHKDTFAKFKVDFEKSGQTSNEFLKANHLKLWEQLVAGGYAGEEFNDFQTEVMEQMKGFLTAKGLESAALVSTLEDYLIEQQPKARKSAAISAGAIRFAQERGFFGDQSFTVKEIAEHFGVAASSLNKYYQELLAYVSVTA